MKIKAVSTKQMWKKKGYYFVVDHIENTAETVEDALYVCDITISRPVNPLRRLWARIKKERRFIAEVQPVPNNTLDQTMIRRYVNECIGFGGMAILTPRQRRL